MTDKTGAVAFLLLMIILVWFYTSGRITGTWDALTGKKVLA